MAIRVEMSGAVRNFDLPATVLFGELTKLGYGEDSRSCGSSCARSRRSSSGARHHWQIDPGQRPSQLVTGDSQPT